MTTEELLNSNLTDEQRAAIIATCDQIRADGVRNSLTIVAAKEAAESSLAEAQKKAAFDMAAANAALPEKSTADTKAAVLSVQTTYDSLLSRAMAALAAFPPEIQTLIAASPLAPVLAEAAAHTSDARKAANAKKRADLEAQLAATPLD